MEVVEPHDRSLHARFTFKGRAAEADLALMAAALAGAMQARRRGPVDVRAGRAVGVSPRRGGRSAQRSAARAVHSPKVLLRT